MTQRRIYQNEYPYFITFCTKDNYPFIEEMINAELLSRIILNAGQLKKYDILAYQIMPNHVHILTNKRTLERVRSGRMECLVSPTERTFSNVSSANKKEFNISDLIQSIKGNFSRKVHQGNIWQRRFYTRIVNNIKYLESVIHYIRHNPIKEDLPIRYHKIPYQYLNMKRIKELF